jgi:hypothetical protein
MNNNMMGNNMMMNYNNMNNMMMNYNNILNNNNINLYNNNNKLNDIIKNENKNLEIDMNFEISFKMKERNINNIYELSNNRIAILIQCNNNMDIVQNKPEYELKIYSLNTFKLLSIIKFKDYTYKIIELKNNDLVRKTSSYFELYKLSAQNYEFFQKIEDKSNLIIGLMNGNLASFDTDGIKIYSKEKDKYKLISNINTEGDIIDAIEIEINKLVIFQKEKDKKKEDIFVICFFDIKTKKKNTN